MATCANCIHHSLCDYNTNISGNGKVRLVYAEGADVKCSFFQNTADVVPKTEVEKIFEEIEGEIKLALDSNYKARSVYNPADEFGMWVQGKIDALRGIEDFIAELKKKYTEE